MIGIREYTSLQKGIDKLLGKTGNNNITISIQSIKYETRIKSYATKMVGSLNLETAQIIPETLELKPETQMTTKVNNGNLFSKKNNLETPRGKPETTLVTNH